MFKECRHILTSGFKCRAAALRGKSFCYYHTASRRLAGIKTFSSILLPSVEDASGVQAAIDQVLRSYASRAIDRRQAGVFFYGLQIAAGLARKTDRDQKPCDTVRDLCDDPKEGLIAPEKSTCEPPDDCVECLRRQACNDYLSYKEGIRTEHEDLCEEGETDCTDTPDPTAGEDAQSKAESENPALVEFPGCKEFDPDPVREYYRGSGMEPPPQLLSPPRKR